MSICLIQFCEKVFVPLKTSTVIWQNVSIQIGKVLISVKDKLSYKLQHSLYMKENK